MYVAPLELSIRGTEGALKRAHVDERTSSGRAALVEDRALGARIFTRIRDAWSATHDGLLRITQQTRLLERNPVLDPRYACGCPISIR